VKFIYENSAEQSNNTFLLSHAVYVNQLDIAKYLYIKAASSCQCEQYVIEKSIKERNFEVAKFVLKYIQKVCKPDEELEIEVHVGWHSL
jgi:hypothetical protein